MVHRGTGNDAQQNVKRQVASLRHLSHRPWPLPDGPWVMGQTWRSLIFAHWRVEASTLKTIVPAPLVVDEHDGSAWIGVSPFVVTGLHPRGLPTARGLKGFLELNVRTYVRFDDRPGILFLTLDATSRLAVAGARLTYRLPYHHAAIQMRRLDGWIDVHTTRPGLTSRLRTRPLGCGGPASPGSLDAFLIERYCLYAAGPRSLLRADIHHRPWQLHAPDDDTTVEVRGAPPLPPLVGSPLVHVAPLQDVLIWAPKRVAALTRPS